jgi:hypothetical protein
MRYPLFSTKNLQDLRHILENFVSAQRKNALPLPILPTQPYANILIVPPEIVMHIISFGKKLGNELYLVNKYLQQRIAQYTSAVTAKCGFRSVVALNKLPTFKNLTYLDIVGLGNATLQEMQSLAELNLGMRTIKYAAISEDDNTLSSFSRYTELRNLELDIYSVTPRIMSTLSIFKNLKTLKFTSSEAKGMALGLLSVFTKLQILDLAITFPTREQLIPVYALTYLEGFSVIGANDNDLKHIGNFKNLTQLSLRTNKITDGLQYLTGSTNLAALNLSNSSYITSEGLLYLTAFKNLKKLDLTSCQSVTDQVLQRLTVNTKLYKLNLRVCSKITDLGLCHLTICSALTDLDLYKCCNLTDETLSALLILTNLQYLNIAYTKITANSLLQFSSLTKLEHLACSRSLVSCNPFEVLQPLKRLDVCYMSGKYYHEETFDSYSFTMSAMQFLGGPKLFGGVSGHRI